ncbi:MAG TPA: hypothetical protein DCF33_09285 [Saprospirales bacterium]|nr:hypothetical protein [Saprospirales bacterium]
MSKWWKNKSGLPWVRQAAFGVETSRLQICVNTSSPAGWQQMMMMVQAYCDLTIHGGKGMGAFMYCASSTLH